MKLLTVAEKEGKMYQFSAELNEDQMRFLLEYAVHDLIKRGLMPVSEDTAPVSGQNTDEIQH